MSKIIICLFCVVVLATVAVQGKKFNHDAEGMGYYSTFNNKTFSLSEAMVTIAFPAGLKMDEGGRLAIGHF